MGTNRFGLDEEWVAANGAEGQDRMLVGHIEHRSETLYSLREDVADKTAEEATFELVALGAARSNAEEFRALVTDHWRETAAVCIAEDLRRHPTFAKELKNIAPDVVKETLRLDKENDRKVSEKEDRKLLEANAMSGSRVVAGKSGGEAYELVVKTMVDVLKGQNRSGAEIKLAEQQAREKMGKLKEAGIPAPKIQAFDREAARTVARPGVERAAEAGKDKGGPRER